MLKTKGLYVREEGKEIIHDINPAMRKGGRSVVYPIPELRRAAEASEKEVMWPRRRST